MFDPKKIRRWRRDVWRIFHAKGLQPLEIPAARVLAAVAIVGTDPSVLSALTSNSEDYVKKVLKRLRKERILSGQTLRTGWADDDSGWCAEMLDAMVACGLLVRGFDERRSAAQKRRAPETRAKGPRKARVAVTTGAVFTPKMQKSNPLYGLAKWNNKPGEPGCRRSSATAPMRKNRHDDDQARVDHRDSAGDRIYRVYRRGLSAATAPERTAR